MLSKSKDEIRNYLRPFCVFEINTRCLLFEAKNLYEQYNDSNFELQIDLSKTFFRLSFCSFFVSALKNIKTMYSYDSQYSIKSFLLKVEEVKEYLADEADTAYDLKYITDTLAGIYAELYSWEERLNSIMFQTSEYELQSYMNFYDGSNFNRLVEKYNPIILELIEIRSFVEKLIDKLLINIFGGIKDKDYTRKYEADINKTFEVVQQFYSDWNEINWYFKNCKLLQRSYYPKLEKLSHQSNEKIRNIMNDVTRFPDNQATVTESSTLLRKYLKEKYDGLSNESIESLCGLFCYSNR